MSGNGGERRCFTCLMSFQILFLETDNQLPCSQAIFYFVWNDQTVPSHREAIEYKNKCNEATIKRTPEVCYLREVSKKVQQPQMEGRNFPVKLLPGQEQKINDWWFLFFFFNFLPATGLCHLKKLKSSRRQYCPEWLEMVPWITCCTTCLSTKVEAFQKWILQGNLAWISIILERQLTVRSTLKSIKVSHGAESLLTAHRNGKPILSAIFIKSLLTSWKNSQILHWPACTSCNQVCIRACDIANFKASPFPYQW